MMHNGYDDYQEGTFIPDIRISRREDNGHYVAESCGLTVTHHEQSEAVNRLTAELQDKIARGELYPGA